MIDRRDRQLGDGQRLDAPDDWLDPPDDGVGSGARGPVDGPSWIGSGRLEPDPPPSTTWLVVGLVAAVALVGLGYWLVSSGDAEPEPTAAAEPPAAPETDIPPVLLAAEAWVADPGSETLRTLLDAVGGFDGVEIGVAEGAFDLVTFDPNDNGRLLATLRNSYGPAENQADNELWTIDDGAVTQAIWNPSVEHDFVHFNPDGTISMWVRSGDTFDFSPRDSIVMDTGRSVLTRTTDPFFPARFAADAGTVFALVSDVPSSVYTALIADDGEVQTVLADGNPYEWVDVPTTGIVIAYPADDTGTTAVWDTQTFDRIDDHVLASRSIVRVAVSADGLIAVGIGFDGSLEVIDMVTGSVTRRFGAVDSAGIQQPISLNDDGSVAVT
ncbi:MAG: hypothetical protein OEU32_18180, partial [Acidimicrobiia bacterium]|nr:hypothetical protein [Acidimicrobiia bacterium]